MQVRLQKCLEKHPIADWSESIFKRKQKMMSSMSEMPHWTFSAFNWDVIQCSSANFHFAHRLRGRPLTRWCDGVG